MKTVLKILTALAAVIGAAYVIATYGDKIVAWAKKLLGKCECLCSDCCCDECDCDCEDDCDNCPCEDDCETCTCGEVEVEELNVEEVLSEEAPAEETVQAEEADFEG